MPSSQFCLKWKNWLLNPQFFLSQSKKALASQNCCNNYITFSVLFICFFIQSLAFQKLGMESRLVSGASACKDSVAAAPARSFLAQQRHITNTRRNLSVKVPAAASDQSAKQTQRKCLRISVPQETTRQKTKVKMLGSSQSYFGFTLRQGLIILNWHRNDSVFKDDLEQRISPSCSLCTLVGLTEVVVDHMAGLYSSRGQTQKLCSSSCILNLTINYI